MTTTFFLSWLVAENSRITVVNINDMYWYINIFDNTIYITHLTTPLL